MKWNYQTVDTADNSVDTLSTEPKNSETTDISLSNERSGKELLTTVDSKKTPEISSPQGLQTKTVDIVDKKNPPRPQPSQSKQKQTVDNQINTSASKVSTEKSSNAGSVRDQGCQQFVNSSSTEFSEPQSNQTVDSLSTELSAVPTVSTVNCAMKINSPAYR